jgi:hypothetical protein
MIVERTGTKQANSKTIEKWLAYLEELHAGSAHRFLRPEIRERVYRYLLGLLNDVRRKNALASCSDVEHSSIADV